VTTEQLLARAALLPERDLVLLELLFQHRFLTRRHVQTFFFADHHDPHAGTTVATRTPRAPQRRLHTLRQHGLLVRRYLARPDGRRESEPYYCLSSAGARLVAARAGLSHTERRRRGADMLANPLFVRHALAAADLHCALVAAARSNAAHECRPEWWQGEQHAAHHFSTGGVTTLVRPDGYTRYQAAHEIHHLLVEIDIGTMPLPRLRAKLDLYRAYARSGAWQQRYPVFPKLLLLTTSERRISRLHQQLTPLRELVLLTTTHSDLHERGPLAAIWRQAGQPGPRPLLTTTE
jgi:hypothetical protein